MDTQAAMRIQIDELSRMTVGQLRQKYLEVFGEESRSNHKQFLFRRIAWRIQALAEGGLSERARRRALEIANDADLRIRAEIRKQLGGKPIATALKTDAAPRTKRKMSAAGRKAISEATKRRWAEFHKAKKEG
jgi:hypothetical protein